MGRGSLGAQQGMRAATATQAEEAALRNHPETTTRIADHELTGKQKRAWVGMACPGLSQEEKSEAVKALEHYSGSGYHAIHDNNPQNSPKVAKEINLIDRVLGGKNAPVYKGAIYRGIKWNNGEKDLKDLIAKGTWTEKGITSMSSSLSVARDGFAGVGWNDGSFISVVLREAPGKNISGVPFRHLSKISSEHEVLLPSSINRRGFSIKKATWTKNNHGATVVYLDVEENLRRKK